MKKFLVLSLVLFCVSVNAQKIHVAQPVIDLGQILFRQPATVKFNLTNKSGERITIQQVRSSCGCTQVGYQTTPVAPDQSFEVTATYDAQTMGHFEKQLAVYVKGSRTPVMLKIRGIVVEHVVDFSGDYPFTIGSLRADKNNLEFDNVNEGERPVQKIHIMNATDQTLQPVMMHLPSYLTAQISPSTFRPGKSGVAVITLDSHQLREYGLTQSTIYLGAHPGEKVSSEKSITLSAVLVPSIGTQGELEGAGPQLRMSADKIQLLPISKKKLRGEVTIENIGTEVLEIQRLQMFTSGMQVSLSSREILPGKSVKLKVTANPDDFQSLRTQPRVLMITNDPDHLKVVLNIER